MAETKTILVVDDDINIVRLVRLVLENDGFTVVTASNGVEALEQINREKPDLVVMDIQMPRLNGLETLQQLRANAATLQLPVIMLTAKESPDGVSSDGSTQNPRYLAKPFKFDELKQAVHEVLADG